MTHEQAVEKHAAERYLLDEMPELERFAFEEHLFACPICAEDVRTGAVMQEGAKAGFLPTVTAEGTDKAEGTRHKAEGTRQKAEEPREPHWRPALPWAVAATLALATGYQTLWVVPDLRSQVIGPSVVSPVTLRGATRGAEPTLTRPRSGVMALAVDLAGVAAGTQLTYDLHAADGVSVASGTAAAPPPGTPLLLLIPVSALDSAGRYTLAVGTAAPGSASVDYPFTITEP